MGYDFLPPGDDAYSQANRLKTLSALALIAAFCVVFGAVLWIARWLSDDLFPFMIAWMLVTTVLAVRRS